MQIKELIDIVGKNISRVKTTGIIVLIILFSLSSVRSGCDRKRAEELAARVSKLNTENTILKANNKGLDIALEKEVTNRKHLEAKLDTLTLDKDKLLLNNYKLRKQLEAISGGVIVIPIDNSYKFLDKVAYPYQGEKKYPFSEPQVKAIHVTYLECGVKSEIINNQQGIIDNCEARISYKDSMIFSYIAESKIKSEKINSLEKMVDNSEEKASIYEKELQKQKRRNNLYKFTTIVGVIGITILLL